MVFYARCRASEAYSSEVRRLYQSAARTEQIYFRTQLRRYSVACDHIRALADILLASKHVSSSSQ